MNFSNPYMDTGQKISTLQRWILVHSYQYYIIDQPTVDDEIFDNNCRQLARAIKKYPEIKTRYSKIFEGFDGSTGFDLYQKCPGKLKLLIIRDSKMNIARAVQNGK